MLKELLKENYEEIKKINNLEQKAKKMVEILFEGKFDKGGKPYMEHLNYIKNNVETENQKIIALLHDTMEDLNISNKELQEIGFPDYITNVVEILTRNIKPKEDYDHYIERIIKSNNIDAYIVKIADLNHNMDLSRIENPSVKDFSRIEKRYRPNYIKLINALKERNEKNVRY